MCFLVTCWERADLLALVCGVFCEFVTFPLVSWVRCGTWLYRFLIFAPLLTFDMPQKLRDFILLRGLLKCVPDNSITRCTNFFNWRWASSYHIQGGQSRGLPDLVSGLYEPVIRHHRCGKSFITFDKLSQISWGKVQNPPHIFCTRLCKSFFVGSLQFSRLPWTTEVCTQSRRIFRFFFPSVIRDTVGNYSKPRRNFETVLCRKYQGIFALSRMKFDLVLRKLWLILLVQEIHAPNHVDPVFRRLDIGTYNIVKQRMIWWICTYQGLHCMHTQSMIVDEDTDQQ